MNRITKVTTMLLILILILLIPNMVFAASASISAGSKTIEKGKSTTISVSINSTETWNLKISSSGGSLSGTTDSTDASDGETSKKVISATFSANSAGTYTIYLTGQIAGSDLKKQTVNKSITITVKEPEPAKPSQNTNQNGSSSSGESSSSGSTTNKKPTTNNTTKKPTNQETVKEEEKSKDSSLATLAVAEGVLSPEFNKDIKEYTVAVPNEVTTVNVAATTTDKKASYKVTGNTELKEGENVITIAVKAEDGSTTEYVIKVKRARPALSLKSLIIKYTNQNGQLIEIPLSPAFSFDVYNYKIEDLEYWVEKLDIQAIANIEGATIDIQGNEELQSGENIITIITKIPVTIEGDVATGEEAKESEEIKTYTISFNKKEEPTPPTLMGRISNWFNGTLAGITTWYAQNQTQVIMGALALCIVALIGLSIYIIVDYKKYKSLLEKLKKVNEINNSQVIENIETQNADIPEPNNDKDNKPKGGKHF